MRTGECAEGSASEAEHRQVEMHAFLRYTALYASASEFLMQHQKQKWFRIRVAETSSCNIGLMQLWPVRCAAVVGDDCVHNFATKVEPATAETTRIAMVQVGAASGASQKQGQLRHQSTKFENHDSEVRECRRWSSRNSGIRGE